MKYCPEPKGHFFFLVQNLSSNHKTLKKKKRYLLMSYLWVLFPFFLSFFFPMPIISFNVLQGKGMPGVI